MPAARTAEAPASIPSQAGSGTVTAAADGERKSFIAVMKYLKESRDDLGTRPSKAQVEAATSAVSSVVSELEKEVETLTSLASPSQDPETAFALKALKEDVARTKAQMKLMPHVSVLELDKKFRHYDVLISAAETALLSGKWKNEDGKADWLNILNSQDDKGTSLAIPSPFLILSFAQVFTPRGPHQNGFSPHISVAPPTTAAAPVLMAAPRVMASPYPLATQPMAASVSEFTARTGETSHAALPQLTPPPSNFFSRAATLNEKPYKDPSVTLQTSFDDHYDTLGGSLYSPGAAPSGRATGYALQPSRLGSQRSGPPAEEPVIVIDPVLLRIIQDSVQSKPMTLDIRGHLFSQPLQVIPETLGFLDSLVELNVSENSLVVLPDSIGSLKKLQQLDASCNHLLEIPRSIGELTELKELDLHHNKMDELPVTIGNCEALEILHIEFNQLKGLPKAIGNLKRLRVLTVHLNQIVTIPMTIGQCESLTELDVHMNQLSGIPESIGRLKNLEKLNVSANHFSLQVLPFSLGQLASLKELDVRENHIKMLPSSVSQLSNLKALKLEGNPWKQPPYAVTQQGMKAVMDYLAEVKDGAYQKGEGSVGGSGPGKKGGAFSLFRRLHKKGEDQEKIESWKSHANTWGA